jgi:preprotein translocase subunit Sss1
MTYPEYILKNFMMTPAEITSRILSDCRRVYLVTDKPLEALYNQFVNQAILAIIIGIVRDVRRMN